VAGFLVIFPLFWAFVCWLVALIGGWRRLAQVYRANEVPSEPGLFARFVAVGLASYRNTITVRMTPTGLHLAVMFLFRPGHPPLAIPWDALRNRRPATFRWWQQAVRFDVIGPDSNRPLTTLTLPTEIAAQLPASRIE
jgi:hypothetical protein